MAKKKKTLNLKDLERRAFPKHTPSFKKLFDYAFTKFRDGVVDQGLENHIQNCAHCQKQNDIIYQSNQILNGEDAKKPKVLVETVKRRRDGKENN